MENEFNFLAKYLLGVKTVPTQLTNSYHEALKYSDCELNAYEKKVWIRMMGSRFYFNLYDSGFAFLNPESRIRRRVFIALAILECNPHYVDSFVFGRSNFKDNLKLLFGLSMGVVYAVLGSMLVYLKI